MPTGILDVVTGRARMMDLTQSVQADLKYAGVMGTAQGRLQTLKNRVMARLGRSTTAPAGGASGGVLATVQARINQFRGVKKSDESYQGTYPGVETQRVGGTNSPAGSEYTSVR